MHYLLNKANKAYQWLILDKDRIPTFDPEVLKKFLKKGFDSELGWVRKPNTSGVEHGRDGKKTYHIGERGDRENTHNIFDNDLISCYGDSYTFCRQVNDNETWQYHLSESVKSNVLNFGVGNYGVDQSLLRLKREFENCPTKIVIMGVVPETISRILNTWKHYHEYGNIFGFKPRYTLEDDNLVLVKNVIDSENKFFLVKDYLTQIQKNDYFYKNKFLRDILYKPYVLSLTRTFKRNGMLLLFLIINKIFRRFDIFYNFNLRLHKKFVLKRNIEICSQLFKDQEVTLLFSKILEDFSHYCKLHDAIPIFLLMPQLNDLEYIKDNGSYYTEFVREVEKKITTIDMTEIILDFLPENMRLDTIGKFYTHDKYGGHMSPTGNELIAKTILDVLKSNKLV